MRPEIGLKKITKKSRSKGFLGVFWPHFRAFHLDLRLPEEELTSLRWIAPKARRGDLVLYTGFHGNVSVKNHVLVS